MIHFIEELKAAKKRLKGLKLSILYQSNKITTDKEGNLIVNSPGLPKHGWFSSGYVDTYLSVHDGFLVDVHENEEYASWIESYDKEKGLDIKHTIPIKEEKKITRVICRIRGEIGKELIYAELDELVWNRVAYCGYQDVTYGYQERKPPPLSYLETLFPWLMDEDPGLDFTHTYTPNKCVLCRGRCKESYPNWTY